MTEAVAGEDRVCVMGQLYHAMAVTLRVLVRSGGQVREKMVLPSIPLSNLNQRWKDLFAPKTLPSMLEMTSPMGA